MNCEYCGGQIPNGNSFCACCGANAPQGNITQSLLTTLINNRIHFKEPRNRAFRRVMTKNLNLLPAYFSYS